MKKSVSIVTLSLLSLTGCNSIRPVGEINGSSIHAIRSTDIQGPNALVLLIERPDGTLDVLGSFGASGILPSAITAGGAVGAAEAFDAGDGGTSVNTSNTNTNSNKTKVSTRGNRGPLSNQP